VTRVDAVEPLSLSMRPAAVPGYLPGLVGPVLP
jgi:hypothetical protein